MDGGGRGHMLAQDLKQADRLESCSEDLVDVGPTFFGQIVI